MDWISPVSQLPVLFIHQLQMRCNVPREALVHILQVHHQDTPLVMLLELHILKFFLPMLKFLTFLCALSSHSAI